MKPANEINAWSRADEQALLVMWADGLTLSEIGRRMNRSKNSVVGKAHRLGVVARPSPINMPVAGTRKPRTIRRAGRVTLDIQAEPVVGPYVFRASTECCWPIGEPRKRGFRFCCEPAIAGRSYCRMHHAIAYLPSSKPNLFVHGGLSRAPERIEDAAVTA